MRDAMSWVSFEWADSIAFSLPLPLSREDGSGSFSPSLSSSSSDSELVMRSGDEDGVGEKVEMPCHGFACLETMRGRKAKAIGSWWSSQ